MATPATVMVGRRATLTGIRKVPQAGRVAVTASGLAGDHVLNVRHHGGPDQAVYVYTQPDLDAWAAALGGPLEPGTFGENVVLDALESATMRVGDRLAFHADGVPGPLLEVTAPRIPCATLAANVGDPDFVKRFARMQRPGAYLRVLRPGTLAAGDAVTVIPADDEAPTLQALFALAYDRRPSPEFLMAALTFPLAVRLRRDVEKRLAELG